MNPLFSGTIFRRNSVQVRNQGGLWDESLRLYRPLGATPRDFILEWVFASGMRVKFAHLEHELTVYNYQGAQIPYIGFDELTHFSSTQFFYMLSRNRSMSGVAGYVRCTTNPDADSWVKELIAWWLGEDGYPIEDRSGVLRWFIRINDSLVWADTREDLIHRYGPETMPKSLTFISAKITDNKILMEKDPAYLANLKALSRVDRMRLLGGNWNVRASAGSMFRREWFPMVEAIPPGWTTSIRFWDRASTLPNETNKDPDWTRGLKMYRYPDNTFLVADLKSTRDTPGQVEHLIKSVASHDGLHTRIMSQRDPGSAGVAEAEHFTRLLPGYDIRTQAFFRDKITRSKPVSAQSEAGNIRVLRAPWNEEFFQELENFPESRHDDIPDVLSGAFNELAQAPSLTDVMGAP